MLILAFQPPQREAARTLLGRIFAVHEIERLIPRKQAAFELGILDGGQDFTKFGPWDVPCRDQIVAGQQRRGPHLLWGDLR